LQDWAEDLPDVRRSPERRAGRPAGTVLDRLVVRRRSMGWAVRRSSAGGRPCTITAVSRSGVLIRLPSRSRQGVDRGAGDHEDQSRPAGGWIRGRTHRSRDAHPADRRPSTPSSTAAKPSTKPSATDRSPVPAIRCPIGSVLMVVAFGQVEGTEPTPVAVHEVFGLLHRPLSPWRVRRQALLGLDWSGSPAPDLPQRRPAGCGSSARPAPSARQAPTREKYRGHHRQCAGGIDLMTGHWLLLPDTRMDRAGFMCPGISSPTSPLGKETLTRHRRVGGRHSGGQRHARQACSTRPGMAIVHRWSFPDGWGSPETLDVTRMEVASMSPAPPQTSAPLPTLTSPRRGSP
jgi:hypothetical protein